jgi:hypothetical protein
VVKIRHFFEAIGRELFWESLQDHGWVPRGNVLVSPDDENISIARNRQMYYRGTPTRTKYSDRNYKMLLRFEENAAKLCKKSPELLNFASEAVQLAAVQQYGYAIRHIKNPSEAVQLAAVQQDWHAIRYIEKPSEALKLAAVQQYGYAIGYITNPSEAVQLAAVQRNGDAIYHIKNPSEAVQLAAVRQYGAAIGYIEDPSEAVKLAAGGEETRYCTVAD